MFILIWLVFCFLVSMVASSRGSSPVLAFFLSAIFSPIIGLIIVLIMPNEKVKNEINELKSKVNNLEN